MSAYADRNPQKCSGEPGILTAILTGIITGILTGI